MRTIKEHKRRETVESLSNRGAFKLKEACTYLGGLSPVTVRRLIARGLIKRVPAIALRCSNSRRFRTRDKKNEFPLQLDDLPQPFRVLAERAEWMEGPLGYEGRARVLPFCYLFPLVE